MKTSRDKPHWQDRRRHVARGRMAWYGEPGDERYWLAYWKERLTPDYYVRAEHIGLHDDELGSILLRYLPSRGLHLEAGCGVGYWVAALREKGMWIEGIEYARELVELARSAHPGLPVRWGDALAIDRPDCTYDTYLSIGVVEHREAGPEPFLREAYRVLKPGGRIIVAVPFYGPLRRIKQRLRLYEPRPSALPFFQYGFQQADMRRLLRQAGFYVEFARPLYAHRLLQEELRGYDRLSSRFDFIKGPAERLLNRRDGHML
ncbi:MAG TPA: methyltransferase domain-containing protein, partial [Ktedonobacteraceae bacterium]|nr:methyltransferase domain-containing protein [Ktedonobacteraceae bacterium]